MLSDKGKITMKTTLKQNLIAAALACALTLVTTVAQAADPLPSWNNGNAKQSIMEFWAGDTILNS
jgi:hypothetical protein